MALSDRAALQERTVLRLVTGGRATNEDTETPTRVPENAFVPVGPRDAEAPTGRRSRLKRRHVLMLALAFEVLCFGFRNAERYQPPGITVEQTLAHGHIIT